MSNSLSERSMLDSFVVTKNADDVPGSPGISNIRNISSSMRNSDSKEGRKSRSHSNSRRNRADSKGGRSRSDSKGRKSSYKRSYHDAKATRSPHTSSKPPKQGKKRVSPKTFTELSTSSSGQTKSTVSTARGAELLYGTNEDAKAKAKVKASRSSNSLTKPDVESVPSSSRHGIRSTANPAHSVAVLYENDEAVKAKDKTSRASNRSSKPAVDSVASSLHCCRSTTSTLDSIAVLYGDKAKASRDWNSPPKPGMELVTSSTHSRSTVNTLDTTLALYGNKANAKSTRGSNRYPTHSLEVPSPSGRSMTTMSSAQSTALLYGMNDRDAIAKAKAKAKAASSHHTHTSSTEILYGHDAKSKDGLSRSTRSQNPGVERVIIEHESERSRFSRSARVEHVMEDESSERSRSSRGARVERFVEDESETTTSSRSASLAGFVAEGEVVGTDRRVASKKRKPQKKKQESYTTKWVILALFIVVISGGVTAFIALRKNDDDQGAQQTQDAGVQDASPNIIPTTAPSEKQVRDPPSAEDCAAIFNNHTTVPGNNSTLPQHWSINIQINVKGETGMTDDMLQELMDSIQELLLPSMAGCTFDQRKLVDVASPSVIRGGASRALDLTIDESRFAIIFAFVKGEVQEGVICVGSTTESCYIVLAKLTIYFDSDIDSAEFKDIIWEEMEDGSDILSKLMLSDSFRSVNATGITNVTSNAPSGSPSKRTTVAPVPEPIYVPDTPVPSTSVPSESPSAMPTGVPSALESTLPTTTSSSLPLLPPTVVPTIRSSRAPSGNPSVETSKPSVETSMLPIYVPSMAPTEAPSVIGSSSPSIPSPSSIPTISSSPSIPSPSSIPTGIPSMAPAVCSRCVGGTQQPSGSTTGQACDSTTESMVDVQCGSCIGSESCSSLRMNLLGLGRLERSLAYKAAPVRTLQWCP